jgi:hypothetical protein
MQKLKERTQMNDAALGKLLLMISCVSFCYYTAWVIMLPFTDPGHAINYVLFQPVRYALLVPASMGLTFIGTLAVFTVYHIHCASIRNEIVICLSEDTTKNVFVKIL